jgi:hypothetical protein
MSIGRITDKWRLERILKEFYFGSLGVLRRCWPEKHEHLFTLLTFIHIRLKNYAF